MALTLTYPAGGMRVNGGPGAVGGGIVRQLAKAGVPLVMTYRENRTKAKRVAAEVNMERSLDLAAPPPPCPQGEPADAVGRVAVLVRQLIDKVRIRRSGTPGDAGNLFAFLASDQTSYITVQIVAIDGGITL